MTLQIGFELTGHCDLRCRHCLRDDLSTVVELSPELFQSIVQQTAALGRVHFAFTGGEVTLHSRFFEFPRIVAEAGRTFHFVTNGNSYPAIREPLLAYRDTLTGISISLEGATEEVHDAIRGRGSFRRTVMAIALAVNDGWKVTTQMVVNRKNRHQMREVAELCQSLGASLLFFAHTQPVERADHNELVLSPAEWKAIDDEVLKLAPDFTMVISRSSGHYDPSPIAHCQTLKHQSFNIDCHGRLTFCCQLSGVSGHPKDADVIADLREVPLLTAIEQHLELATTVTRDRLRYLVAEPNDEYRDFHCHFCLKRFGKLAHRESGYQKQRRLRVVDR